jgi:membrane-associated protease RseP (regulator of RpoE activity)
MRFWPFRGRRVPVAPSAAVLVFTEDLLRRGVDDVFVVRDCEIRGGIVTFRGALREAPARALDTLLARLQPLGFTPFLKAEGGEIVLQAWPLADTRQPTRVGLNVVLFALTCVSTLFAGAFFSGSPLFDALRTSSMAGQLVSGVPFAFTLLAILGVHEFGHYFTARHYRASVSLPYFIPAPPPLFLFGTMGAIIRMRSPVINRNVLFDIAAAGPLAGLLVAFPAIFIGLEWSSVVPVPPGGYVVFGDSLLLRGLVYLRWGTIPEGLMVFTHPIADAAWAGLFVTAVNLFPVGQLDGGRIAYALFGHHHRAVGMATVAGLVLMGLWTLSANWFVWALLIVLLIGFHHSPPLDDITPLSPGRRVVGIVCLLLLILLIPPVPIGIT